MGSSSCCCNEVWTATWWIARAARHLKIRTRKRSRKLLGRRDCRTEWDLRCAYRTYGYGLARRILFLIEGEMPSDTHFSSLGSTENAKNFFRWSASVSGAKA